MAKTALAAKKLDARPDRVDFRDRPYLPPLRSLPPQWPPKEKVDRYLENYAPLILDQGQEGACTGFGLAAVINYTYWLAVIMRQLQAHGGDEKKVTSPKQPRVSAHMLYRNAKLYDEWEGEDYEGSSCRGAMKGWHKHGVCNDDLWNRDADIQGDRWRVDAAQRPLGAYYRVDAKSLADMQAAIYETGAVYCSADVHDGWSSLQKMITADGLKIAGIVPQKKKTGGHAFALVGYTPEGFIVQNSWGSRWGTHGFALLTYQDWIANGYDAWVAAIGAPMSATAPATAGRGNLQMAALDGRIGTALAGAVSTTDLWNEDRAYRHAVVLGNDGKLLNRIVGAKDAHAALTHVLVDEIGKSPHKDIALYVHGGLNDEHSAISRARRLGPWFDANGIHPVFLIWRTGLMESLGSIAQDEIKSFEDQAKAIRAKGFGNYVKSALEALAEAKDRAFEAAAEKLIGKAVWTQMKQNAAMAAESSGALASMLSCLSKRNENPHLKKNLHLMGHSAGAIMIGHMLDVAARQATPDKFKSCGLYAPACRLDFATEKYGDALSKGGPLYKALFHIDALTDKAEVGDSVGPYGKSLLYLVSRALEDKHKTPILGLELCLDPAKPNPKPGMEFDEAHLQELHANWMERVGSLSNTKIEYHRGPQISCSRKEKIPIAHGTFDNDIAVVSASIGRILNGRIPVPVTDLTGY